jgi:hypothetical protein
LHSNMTQWWVLYRFTTVNDHSGCHPASVPVQELSIVRLLADLTTDGTPCAYCFARRQPICPGMKMHVTVERERAELDASGLLQVAVIDLPDWMGWHLAMPVIKTLILAQEIISAP